ncbi:MAG: dTMP kinase [Planctomycetota bacterium]|jgi:dTMP kinase
MEQRAERGLFVVMDGVDGCGKSTQAARLVERLGADTLHLREPGSTVIGENLRAMLLDPSARIDEGAEPLLFAAARRQMLDELVEPALRAGRHVVCERFNGSTYAYQAVARGRDPEAVVTLLENWCGQPAPDLEVILTVDVARAVERRGADRDRIEARGEDYQRAVADGFREYAARFARVTEVDGEGAIEEVGARIDAALEELLDGRE